MHQLCPVGLRDPVEDQISSFILFIEQINIIFFLHDRHWGIRSQVSKIWLILVSEAVTSRDQEDLSGRWHLNLGVKRGDDLLYKSTFGGKMKVHTLFKCGAKYVYTFFLKEWSYSFYLNSKRSLTPSMSRTIDIYTLKCIK